MKHTLTLFVRVRARTGYETAVYMYVYVSILCIYVYICIYICIFVCAHAQATRQRPSFLTRLDWSEAAVGPHRHTHTDRQTHTHTRTHTHARTHTRTHARTRLDFSLVNNLKHPRPLAPSSFYAPSTAASPQRVTTTSQAGVSAVRRLECLL